MAVNADAVMQSMRVDAKSEYRFTGITGGRQTSAKYMNRVLKYAILMNKRYDNIFIMTRFPKIYMRLFDVNSIVKKPNLNELRQLISEIVKERTDGIKISRAIVLDNVDFLGRLDPRELSYKYGVDVYVSSPTYIEMPPSIREALTHIYMTGECNTKLVVSSLAGFDNKQLISCISRANIINNGLVYKATGILHKETPWNYGTV
jgi:hypothetical protein